MSSVVRASLAQCSNSILCTDTQNDSEGLFFGFNVPACISIFVSAIGGLIVAAVLKFADAGELVMAGSLIALRPPISPSKTYDQSSKDMRQQ